MKQISFEHEGTNQRGWVQRVGTQIWYHFGGKAWSEEISTPGRKRASRGATTKEPGVILATMPGKITKLFVNEGETVSKGDSVLVMEAMKMEYTLKADIPGVIGAVNAKVGDQVKLGQLILKIKGQEEE